jgi:hypothetical protein
VGFWLFLFLGCALSREDIILSFPGRIYWKEFRDDNYRHFKKVFGVEGRILNGAALSSRQRHVHDPGEKV